MHSHRARDMHPLVVLNVPFSPVDSEPICQRLANQLESFEQQLCILSMEPSQHVYILEIMNWVKYYQYFSLPIERVQAPRP